MLNLNLIELGETESNSVKNSESNPVKQGESNQVKDCENNQVRHGGQSGTDCVDDGASIGYLKAQLEGY